MDKKYIDLHVHSTASDGTLTPTEVVKLAASEGLSAIALTDHDTIDGIKEAMSVAGEYGIELIPGIEFSTAYEKREVHMLGLFIDPDNYALNEKLNELVATRNNRNEQMAANQTAPVYNQIGLTTQDYAEAVMEVAEYLSVPCIDVFGNCGVNQFNRNMYLEDLVHPNKEGGKAIAKVIIGGLKTIAPVE